ncbi:hypothetical protein HBI56_113400 [Parastagonospora nodorum]|nr:hypothetical protein HBH53_041400 [Parastagonospora nodorum]KAH4036427.1 hypothetical protein HBI09_072820 [Parastagonospora nodorum]KAH4127040.1 hypothetical protein HBH47_051380 [Parastagonospora nodorum]KAH4604213.1 hypothetical protein HBH82_131770 [Parastagonospora nodorum]KAH4690627.1 hypothetical protein HBH78_091090 [Parastagonospora nodorum]
MTRWHQSSCANPDVFLTVDQIPSCRTCSRTCPSVDHLIAQRKGGAEPLTLPDDELPGQMDLWWPRSIPYVRGQERSPPLSTSLPTETKPEPLLEQSILYGVTLNKEEFRLACLSAVPEPDYPLHLTLEIVADHDHPEYECASYSWGGEEGDSSLCQPVYIGDYWDILLQTRNCWSMLCFLRPKRGVRMVWVDAICINQENTNERGAQVAKMRQIYETCLRVVVYLGDDLVTMPENYPTWQAFNTIEDASSHSLRFATGHRLCNKRYGIRDLLSRRYFSRIWVIQELVVPEEVVIRLGNVNFSVNARTIDNTWFAWKQDDATSYPAHSVLAPHRSQWSTTSAPWFEHLAHKAFPSSDVKDVLSLLRLTINSSASDPRDRLFGVISLLGIPHFQRDLSPNYSLSFLHFSIGLFAHLFIKEGRCWFLGSAGVAIRRRNPIEHKWPSWVPHCKSEALWRDLLVNAPEIRSSRSGHSLWPAFDLYHDRYNLNRVTRARYMEDTHNHHSTSIHSSTGALSISVAHIFGFEGGLRLEGNHGPVFTYMVERRSASGMPLPSRLLLATLGEIDILPDRDHLYIPVSAPKIYLILRRCIDSSQASSFELVTSCVRLFDEGFSPIRTKDFNYLAYDAHHNPETWSRVGSVPVLDGIQSSLSDHIISLRRIMGSWTTSPTTLVDRIHKKMEPDFENFFLWSVLPSYPEPAAYMPDVLPNVLSLCLAIHEDDNEWESFRRLPRMPHLENRYLDCLNESFLHKIEEVDNRKYIHVALDMRHWTERRYEKTFGDLNKHRDPGNGDEWWTGTFNWTWRFMDREIWHRAEKMLPEIMKLSFETTGSKKSTRTSVIVRIPLEILLRKLQQFLWGVEVILERVFTLFDGHPDFHILARMIRSNPYHELTSYGLGNSVGCGYYLGNVRIDGRISNVCIV